MMSYLCSVAQAIEKLNKAQVVGLPTETVYGLAGRIDRSEAIGRIFEVKQRPFFDPLIVHVASLAQAQAVVREWPEVAQVLAEAFWPGPLTLVLEKNSRVSDLITSGLSSVGIRWPQHPLAQEVIRSVGVPLAAPSANLFGRTSPTLASHVLEEFAEEDLAVLDGGPCAVGIESTVLSLKKASGGWEYSILRPGLISHLQIQEVFAKSGLSITKAASLNRRESPGQMQHHYMPSKPLVVSFLPKLTDQKICEKFLNKIGEIPDVVEGVTIRKPKGKDLSVVRLVLSSDSRQAARELYAELRRASATKADLLFLDLSGQGSGSGSGIGSGNGSGNGNDQDPNWSAIQERVLKAATLVIE